MRPISLAPMGLITNALLAVVLASHVAAQPTEGDNWRKADPASRFAPREFVLLPARDAYPSTDALFVADSAAPLSRGLRAHQQRLEAIDSVAAARLKEDERVYVLDVAGVRQRLEKKTNLTAALALVRERLSLGRSLYENLQLEAAEKNLQAARESALKHWADVVEPGLYADIEFALALTYLDLGRPALADISFKRMFRAQPTRRFARGYYSKNAEKALKAALTDIRTTDKNVFPLDLDRLETLLRAAKADDALTGRLVQSGATVEVKLVAYSGKDRSYLFRDQFQLPAGDGAEAEQEVRETLDLAVSRLLGCLPASLRTRKKSKSRFGRFMLDTSGAYGTYFGKPTREVFHMAGFVVNAAYAVRPMLDVFGKITVYTAFADARQDLQDNALTSVRAIIGAGVAFEDGIWRGFLRPGIDIHYVAPFTVVTDPSCKFWGMNDSRCSGEGNGFKNVDSALMGGVNLASGVSVAAGGGIYVTLQGNFSLYFPLVEDTDLNYLMAAELGVGYSF